MSKNLFIFIDARARAHTRSNIRLILSGWHWHSAHIKFLVEIENESEGERERGREREGERERERRRRGERKIQIYKISNIFKWMNRTNRVGRTSERTHDRTNKRIEWIGKNIKSLKLLCVLECRMPVLWQIQHAIREHGRNASARARLDEKFVNFIIHDLWQNTKCKLINPNWIRSQARTQATQMSSCARCEARLHAKPTHRHHSAATGSAMPRIFIILFYFFIK